MGKNTLSPILEDLFRPAADTQGGSSGSQRYSKYYGKWSDGERCFIDKPESMKRLIRLWKKLRFPSQWEKRDINRLQFHSRSI